MTYHSYYKSPDLIGPWISRQIGIPYVIFQPMYGTRRRKSPSTSPGFLLNHWALMRSSHVFVNNLRDLEALHRILPPERITYLKPGIHPEAFDRDPDAGRRVRRQFGIAEDHFVILTAARWREGVKTESFLYLLESLVQLNKRFRDFTLLVVGDGPMEPTLQKKAYSALSGKVTFAGRIPRHEMFRFYSAADIFAFPGIGESLGMVFLEAQSCGTPVVALNTAGVPQVVIDSETGMLVPRDDGRAMAQAIEGLARNPVQRHTMGRSGALFVRRERNLHRNYLRLSREIEKIVCDGNSDIT
jgi:glycosyltransferase involved in cell wall biosynthesis